MTPGLAESSSGAAAIRDLHPLERRGPSATASSEFSHEGPSEPIAGTANQWRNVPATAQQPFPFHHQLTQASGQGQKQQPQPRLREQRSSRVITASVAGEPRNQRPSNTALPDPSPDARQETTAESRGLLQRQEGRAGVDFLYEESVHPKQVSSNFLAASDSPTKQVDTETNIVTGKSAAASTRARELGPREVSGWSDAVPLGPGAASVPLPARTPASVLPSLPSQGPTAPLSPPSKNGYLLPPKSLPHPRTAAVTSGITTDHVDAFYFAAAAIGCSGLLCAAGFILLLAIFRNYRLRQQKHEATKKFIRRIHRSGELHRRNRVVYCSRESLAQNQPGKRNCPPGPVLPTRILSTSPFVHAHQPGAEPGAPLRAQEHGKEALSNTTDFAAPRNIGTGNTPTESKTPKTSQSEAGAGGHYCRRQNSRATGAALHAVKGSKQASEGLGALEEVTGAVRPPVHAHPAVPPKGQEVQGLEEPHTLADRKGVRKITSTLDGVCDHSSSLAAPEHSVTAPAHLCNRATPALTSRRASIFPRLLKWTKLERRCTVPSPSPQSPISEPDVRPQPRRQTHLGTNETPWFALNRTQKPPSMQVIPRKNTPGSSFPEQPLRAARGRSTSLIHIGFFASLPLPRRTTKVERNVQASESQPVSPLSCRPRDDGQENLSSYMRAGALQPRMPVQLVVNPQPGGNSNGHFPLLSSAASRVAHLLGDLRSCAGRSSSCVSPRNDYSRCTSATDTSLVDRKRSRHALLGCSKLRRGAVLDHQNSSEPGKPPSGRRPEQNQLSSCPAEENVASTSLESGDITTWVSEVSESSTCVLGIKSCHDSGSYGHKALAGAHNAGEDGGSSAFRTTGSEWAQGSNADIPTHMMTTAINNEEGDSSESAASSGPDVTESEDDAIVEFDSSNISVAPEDAAHSQDATSENIR